MIPWSGAVAHLGLGSNQGDRLELLQRAVDLLDADRFTVVEAVSSVYETDPVGGPPQPEYYNVAVRVRTRRPPRLLLGLCHRTERQLGRVRGERWGPRTLDVDILLYAGRTVARRDLQIPHPRLTQRPFALIPLIEVAAGETLPDGSTLTAALARLAPVEGVRMIGAQVRPPSDRDPDPDQRGRRGAGGA